MSNVNIIKGTVISENKIIGSATPPTQINVSIKEVGAKGDKGDKGEQGNTGMSAYEVWLQLGNTGTEEEFLSSIIPLPENLPASSIVEDSERVFLTSSEKSNLLSFKESYIHNQMESSAKWIVNHNLGKFPSVTVKDSAESLVVGEIDYVDNNSIILTFTAEFSGKAYLN